VRTLFTETEATHVQTRVQWQILWDSNEVLWYSQRDNTAQMYLYDLKTGALKNPITERRRPDHAHRASTTKTRTMWYEAVGKEAGQDPYFTHLYKVGLDGKEQRLADARQRHAHHANLARRQVRHRHVLAGRRGAADDAARRSDGRADHAARKGRHLEVARDRLEAADADQDEGGQRRRRHLRHALPSDELQSGARSTRSSTTPTRVRSRGSVGSRAFTAARGDKQALAELGFIVVSIDGTRHTEPLEEVHRRVLRRDGPHNTLPDQIAGMKESGQAAVPVDRHRQGGDVGTLGWRLHHGGCVAAARRINDFFKVGIAESGNHDQRSTKTTGASGIRVAAREERRTGRQLHDRSEPDARGRPQGPPPARIHGTMDNNVPPYNTYLVADALIKANKDFDLLMIPNAGHGFTARRPTTSCVAGGTTSCST
jgi:dipeptidyl-peptidase-4